MEEVPGVGELNLPWWAEVLNFLMIVVLVTTSGLSAGLTLGLLSLDKIGLEIIVSGENKTLADCARKIQPLRENGNLLLCTLLFANVALNAAISILSAHLTTNLVGFLLSTLLILIFAEIIPMSVCGRYALQIGARAVPFVKVVMFLFYPLCKPFAVMLDFMLGEEIGTIHSRQELMKLLEIHVQHGSLDAESGAMVGGALRFKSIKVKDAMTPVEKVFSLKENEVLDFKTLAKIFKNGFSRIPIYENNINDTEKFLFVKDLIFLDPQDATLLKNFIAGFGRSAFVVTPDTKLDKVLEKFKAYQGKMALVKESTPDFENGTKTVGIITLEDIMKSIIGRPLSDASMLESSSSGKPGKDDRQAALDFARVSFSTALKEAYLPSLDEAKTITSFVLSNLNLFQTKGKKQKTLSVTYEQAIYMVRLSPILHLKGNDSNSLSEFQNQPLYRRGTQATVLTLVLEGNFTVFTGRKESKAVYGAWSILAPEAILHEEGSFKPDFTAFVSSTQARCIQISRSVYEDAILPIKERRYQKAKSENWVALVRRNSKKLTESFGQHQEEFKDEARCNAHSSFHDAVNPLHIEQKV